MRCFVRTSLGNVISTHTYTHVYDPKRGAACTAGVPHTISKCINSIAAVVTKPGKIKNIPVLEYFNISGKHTIIQHHIDNTLLGIRVLEILPPVLQNLHDKNCSARRRQIDLRKHKTRDSI